jgi:hypothetical protein
MSIVFMNTKTRHTLFSKFCEYNLKRKRIVLFVSKMDSLQAPTKQKLLIKIGCIVYIKGL